MSKVRLPRMTLERGAALCMACAGTISLLAGAGWLFNRPVLASFNPNFLPMAPATVLIFLGLCVAWLFQRIFPTRRWIKTLVQVALVGMIIIVIFLVLRYFTGLGPDLEKILYPAPSMFGQFSSARMSPLSALGFFLAIMAFLLLTAGPEAKKCFRGPISSFVGPQQFNLPGLPIRGAPFLRRYPHSGGNHKRAILLVPQLGVFDDRGTWRLADQGVHWHIIKATLDADIHTGCTLDCFAAGISQYGG